MKNRRSQKKRHSLGRSTQTNGAKGPNHQKARSPTTPKRETWCDVLASEKARKSALLELPRELRGPSNNKYGGHQAQSMKTYETDWTKTYTCVSLSKEEIIELEQQRSR